MENNINERVKEVQTGAGWDVGPAWYEKYITQAVGNDATEDQMFEAFIRAFNEHFPTDENGVHHADEEALTLGAKPLEQ